MSDENRQRRRFDRALVALFCAALVVPMAGRLSGWAPPFDPLVEKRNAAPLPTIETRQVGPVAIPKKRTLIALPAKFEAYFNDRYGFRGDLLGLYAQARSAGVVPAGLERPGGAGMPCASALIGRGGWLYIAAECIDNYRATRPFSPEEVEQWATSFARRRDWLAGQNTRYVYFFAPDKHTIYPEFLPPAINRVGPQTRLDQLTARLAGDASYLDIRNALFAGKSQRYVYYQTDTHWNAFGAWIGYRQVTDRIGPAFPWLKPDGLDAFDIVAGETRGDLATILPSSNWPERGGIELRRKRASQAVETTETISLDSGTTVEIGRCRNPSAPGGRIVVVHDSFFMAMKPLFNEHWQEVIYWHNDHGFPADLIRRERPELVVHEVVERRLMRAVPTDPPLDRAADLQWAERHGGPRGNVR